MLRCSRLSHACWVQKQAKAGVICLICSQEHSHQLVVWCLRFSAVAGAALPLVPRSRQGPCHQSRLLVWSTAANCWRAVCGVVPQHTTVHQATEYPLRWCGLVHPSRSRQGCTDAHLCHLCFHPSSRCSYTSHAQRAAGEGVQPVQHTTGLQETARLVVVIVCLLLAHVVL